MSDLQSLRPAIEQATGVLIMFLVLLDIFLTVLYVRMGTSFLVKRLARLTWRGFLLIAKLSPSRRPAILSFAGPSMLLVFVVFWGMALIFGRGLIVHLSWAPLFALVAVKLRRIS